MGKGFPIGQQTHRKFKISNRGTRNVAGKEGDEDDGDKETQPQKESEEKIMSPTLRLRRQRLYGNCDDTAKTPRLKLALDDKGKPLVNRMMQAVGNITAMLNMFTRRAQKAEKLQPNRIDGHVVIRVKSRLLIKRKMDGRHIVARQYKKLVKGLCGGLTWAELNKLPTDKAGHMVMPASPLHRIRLSIVRYLRENPPVENADGTTSRKKWSPTPQPLTRAQRRAKERAEAKAAWESRKALTAVTA